MTFLDVYEFWKTDDFFGLNTRKELDALDLVADAKEIGDELTEEDIERLDWDWK